jgi:hypothetical protein
VVESLYTLNQYSSRHQMYKTDTFVKVAVQLFSKGCVWQKELCENDIPTLSTMTAYRGNLRKAYSEYQRASRYNIGAPEASKYLQDSQ